MGSGPGRDARSAAGPDVRRPERGSRPSAPGRPAEGAQEYRACVRKRRYETRVEAAKAAEKSSRRRDAPRIYVYECPYCGGWHLTHRRPRS